MKKIIFLLNILMILIFASCKDENSFMPGDDGLTCYSILVSAPNNATRAVYDESADGSSISVKWEKGDVIYVGSNQFVYKEDRDAMALFIHYGDLQGTDRKVKFGEDENDVQIQEKNKKCHEVLVGTVPADYFTKAPEEIKLLPETGKSLLHIQAKSPAMFMGKSLLKIKGLATEDYTVQLGTDPSLVFADKNEQLDIYVTVPEGTISSGRTLKFYFYAYDKNTPTDLTHGDEYHYYMKCNASISTKNDEVIKLSLPNKPTHAAIQMGLSVKWATMNVGATSDQPGEASFGGYYPWGETQAITEPKGTDCYLNGKDENALKDIFGNSDIQGITKTIGGVVYGDAATESWGDDWMLPNVTQMNELVDYALDAVGSSGWVDWKNTDVPHIKTNGRYFKGKEPYSDKKIWLPAAGGVHTQKRVAGQVASNDGCNGVYMTSIPARTDGFNNMSFNKTQVAKSGSWTGSYDWFRHHGVSVRPVRKPN